MPVKERSKSNFKGPLDMKTKIVQAARAMFMESGYENASVNGLIDRLHIAKGTFYHYFASKEELLDTVVTSFSGEIMVEINRIMSGKADAMTKFNAVISIGRQKKVENIGFLKMLWFALYRPENTVLLHKLMKITVKESADVLGKIISQGDREGVFRSVGSKDAGLIIMNIGASLSDSIYEYMMKKDKSPEDDRRIEELAETYDRSIARLLGVKEGTITFMDRKFLKALRDA